MIRAAAVFGFLGVALGAFGAHGLKDVLLAGGRAAVWETATLYLLVHAVALLAVALHMPRARVIGWLWGAGMVIFSGSLYVLALTGVKGLGAVTPVGGVLLLGGWVWLACRRIQ